VVVFDDVGYSSDEMERAWATIGTNPRVSRALRFGRMGAALVGASASRESPALR
jgi:hypothetical protein